MVSVTLWESTGRFQQGLVYCTKLRPLISCLMIIQSCLHSQDPSLFHLPLCSGDGCWCSSYTEKKQVGVGRGRTPWVEAGSKQRLSLLWHITDNPGTPGDPALGFLKKNTKNFPILAWKNYDKSTTAGTTLKMNCNKKAEIQVLKSHTELEPPSLTCNSLAHKF